LSADGAGNLFVADAMNYRILKVAKDGSQSVMPVTNRSVPITVAVNSAGTLFVADSDNQILELPQGGTQHTFPPNASAQPGGVAVDGAGNVFFSDAVINQVMELPKGGQLVALSFTGLTSVAAVAVDSVGDVFVVDGERVVEMPKGSPQIVLGFTGVTGAAGLAVDSVGTVYLADHSNQRVLELAPGGTQVTLPFGGLNNPISVAVDDAGTVYVADSGLQRIIRLTKSGAQITMPISGITLPISVAVDAVGDLFVLDWAITTSNTTGTDFGPQVIEFSWFGRRTAVPVSSLSTIAEVQYLAADRDGDVFLSEQQNNRVVELPVDHATFTSPLNGQLNVDSSKAFTWSPTPDAQGYVLVVGTTVYGTDLVSSGILPAGTTSFAVAPLPTGKVLYATLLTEQGGSWSHFQLIGFIVTR
jgi:serine/threonine-protein kinase